MTSRLADQPGTPRSALERGPGPGPGRVLRAEGSPTRVVRLGGIEFGGGFVVIAGPCAVEGAEQIELAASAVRAAGAHLLRGGAFKPRTSPYAFQGMGEPGLRLLCEAGRRHGLPVIAEDPSNAGTGGRPAGRCT